MLSIAPSPVSSGLASYWLRANIPLNSLALALAPKNCCSGLKLHSRASNSNVLCCPADSRAKLLALESRYKTRDAELAIRGRECLQDRRGLTSQWKSMYTVEHLQLLFVTAVEKPESVWPNSQS